MRHEAEFRKLLTTGSDYDELLRMGHVARAPDDIDEWRKAMRAKARADRVKIRTGRSARDPTIVWAYLKHLDDRRLTEREQGSAARHIHAVSEAFERAKLRGHDVRRVLRAENEQAAAVCGRCAARLYVDWGQTPVYMEGEVFDLDCHAG